MNYISYIRVSTEKQGHSGLGLSAQKKSINNFVSSTGGTLLGEYQDIESGSKTDREGLSKAIRHALTSGATLLVKKLDRLSRDGFKITTQLDELGIPYMDVESPHDPELIKNIKLALAKDERQKIAERTKAALDEIKQVLKEQGQYTTKEGKVIKSLGYKKTLGGPKAIAKSVATRRRKAKNNPANIQATGIIVKLKEQGDSFAQITRFLNDNGFKTSRGNAYSQTQVTKLYRRASSSTAGTVVSNMY